MKIRRPTRPSSTRLSDAIRLPYEAEPLEPRRLLSSSASTTSVNKNPVVTQLVLSKNPIPLLERSPGAAIAMGLKPAPSTDGTIAASPTAQPALAPSFAAPAGSLSGKVVITSGGHGYFYTTPGATGGSWTTGRGETNEIVEDLGNQDQMSFYAQYALQAGATVVPMRPVGHQTNEVIVDNADTGFSIVSGSWGSSVNTPYFSTHDGNDAAHYRYANTAPTETAVARFTPSIPAEGFYPVYAWAKNDDDRVTDQTYRVNFTGGSVEVKIDTLNLGKGWIYLGTYYFAQGASGNVEVSNKSATSGDSQVVIADAIRFGNGMGDTNRGGGISGKSREDENAYYWITAQRGWTGTGTRVALSTFDGGNSDDDDANVGAPVRWGKYMYAGSFSNAIYLGMHSNAAGGRGVDGLYNDESLFPNTATPNQFAWAALVGHAINDELSAMTVPPLETAWPSRGTSDASVTFRRTDYAFGEIRTSSVTPDEFDATIAEVAYHDNALDAQLLRDPKVRAAIARALYHATVKYFNTFTGTSAVLMPDTPTAPRALSNANGTVTLTWTPPATNATTGNSGAPTGYKVYTSTNGYGFNNPITLGNVTTYTISGLPTNAPTYFKIVAFNAGGESLTSDVVAAKPNAAALAQILIVNGFDRLDRTTDEFQRYGTSPNTIDRVRLRYNNTRDYVARFADAVRAYDPSLGIDTVQNEDVVNNVVNLANYKMVLWISGTESTADETFSAAEQSKVSAYINGGGRLFASGSELAWDLDGVSSATAADRTYLNAILHADYLADDANTYNTVGVAGSIFAAIPALSFDNGNTFTYDVRTPDVLAVSAGSTAALNYSGGTAGAAAVQWAPLTTGARVVTMGFPFETITTAANRNAVMAAVLNYFSLSLTPGTPDLLAASDTGSSPTDNLTRLNNSPGNTLQFSIPNTVLNAAVSLYDGANLIGAGTGNGGTLTLTTNASFTLTSGTHTLTVKQTQTAAGLATSAPSASLTITVDAVPPTLTFAAIANPRTIPVSAESITLSETTTGLTAANFTLTRDGGPNLLTPTQTLTGSGTSFSLNNLAPLTSAAGTYTLTFSPTGVTDPAGNAATPSSITWRNTAVTATPANDTLYLVRNSSNPSALDVTLNGNSYTVNLASLGQLSILGAGGTDSITLDFSNGTPTFDPSAGLTLSLDPTSSLNIIGSAGDDTAAISATAATINSLPITLTSSPANLSFTGSTGNDSLSLTNRPITSNADASLSTTNLSLTLAGTATATFTTTQHLAALNLLDTATATLTPGGNKVLVTSTLSLAPTSRLDLTDNDLAINAPPDQSVIRSYLQTGSLFSSSSTPITALGYALASDLGVNFFSSQPVTTAALLIKYTYLGDTDLDGRLTYDDLARLDRGRAKSSNTWLAGDSNYDGLIDSTDSALAHIAFRDQGAPL